MDDPTNPNLLFLTSIDKTSRLGASYLKTITKDNVKYILANAPISSLIYNQVNLINFDSFTTASLKFTFESLGSDHSSVYIRMAAYSSCNGIS